MKSCLGKAMEPRQGLGGQDWDDGQVGEPACGEAEEARQGLGSQERAKDEVVGEAVIDTAVGSGRVAANSDKGTGEAADDSVDALGVAAVY